MTTPHKLVNGQRVLLSEAEIAERQARDGNVESVDRPYSLEELEEFRAQLDLQGPGSIDMSPLKAALDAEIAARKRPH